MLTDAPANQVTILETIARGFGRTFCSFAMSQSNVKYPKEMREYAKQNKKELATIALPGMVYQTPISPEESEELWKLFNDWFHKRMANHQVK